jgi:hypothetical protein
MVAVSSRFGSRPKACSTSPPTVSNSSSAKSLPKRGETAVLEGLRFRILHADSRRLYTMQVERLAPPAGADRPA